MASNTKPWERQKDETTKQFEAFQMYRDMGTSRSIRAVAEELEKSETLIGRWSSKNDWVERCEAWDMEQDRVAREAQKKEIVKMRKKHADLAQAMLVKAALALKSIPVEEIKASDVSRMVETASKLERLSRGDVGEVIEERDGGKVESVVSFYIPDNGRDNKMEEVED